VQYTVELSRRAQRELANLQMQDLLRVSGVIKGLRHNPRPKGVRKIRGSIHRVRAGDWRVIYAIFDKDRLVIIGKVARRSEDTYNRVDELF
jgi:mRNA-degrading endonuclease RelE of RelBE toxin-antitoxin system